MASSYIPCYIKGRAARQRHACGRCHVSCCSQARSRKMAQWQNSVGRSCCASPPVAQLRYGSAKLYTHPLYHAQLSWRVYGLRTFLRYHVQARGRPRGLACVGAVTSSATPFDPRRRGAVAGLQTSTCGEPQNGQPSLHRHRPTRSGSKY